MSRSLDVDNNPENVHALALLCSVFVILPINSLRPSDAYIYINKYIYMYVCIYMYIYIYIPELWHQLFGAKPLVEPLLINILRPGQNARHFADDIFKRIF